MDSKENLTYKIEITKLYYDEFKYRHTHFWQIYFKYMYAMLFLFAIYFIGAEYIDKLPINRVIVLILVILAVILVTIVGTITLKEEYYRIKCVNSKYDDLLLEGYKHQKPNRICNGDNLVVRLGNWQIFIFMLLGLSLIGILIYIAIVIH
ncbi:MULTISPECIES: hypothetical protein [unclassified Clostridium]|uniref:hypothetical protein n=1 Tax=unclassified Clostridium TaxID=2614128 RepID=UPI00207A8726|nr:MULTISPECIES: hypothetical protein [unclassified Clostridium]